MKTVKKFVENDSINLICVCQAHKFEILMKLFSYVFWSLHFLICWKQNLKCAMLTAPGEGMLAKESLLTFECQMTSPWGEEKEPTPKAVYFKKIHGEREREWKWHFRSRSERVCKQQWVDGSDFLWNKSLFSCPIIQVQERDISSVQFSRSVMSDSVTPWIAAYLPKIATI